MIVVGWQAGSGYISHTINLSKIFDSGSAKLITVVSDMIFML